ncbi:putative ubiquitin-associated domain-containing protein 2-like [Capsicum annuum]|nr:putative ubiquitin-associated domain-containing protein 2-like [Capsicum annuum]
MSSIICLSQHKHLDFFSVASKGKDDSSLKVRLSTVTQARPGKLALVVKVKNQKPLELRAEQGTFAFDAEYSRWLEEQNKHINELRNAVNFHASDPELRSIVNNVTVYFDEVFKVKGNAAKEDVSMSCQGCGKPLPSGVLCGMVASAPRNFLRDKGEQSFTGLRGIGARDWDGNDSGRRTRVFG